MKRLIKPLAILIVSVMVISFCSCTSLNSGNTTDSDGSSFYIKVGDVSLSKEYIGYFFYVAQLNMIKEAGMILGEGGNSTDEDVATFWKTTEIEGKSAVNVARDLAADNAVMQTVQYLKAVDEGVTIPDEENEQITAQINNTIELNGGREAFDKLLADMGCDADAYRQILLENKYVEKLFAMYDSNGKLDITDDELMAYTANHGEDISPEIILETAKKDKFNKMINQWEDEYQISISDEKMKEFMIKK